MGFTVYLIKNYRFLQADLATENENCIKRKQVNLTSELDKIRKDKKKGANNFNSK